MSLLEQLEDDSPAVEVLRQPLPPREDPVLYHKDRLRRIEDELLEESLEVVQGVVRFAHLPPDLEEPPEDWVEAHGREKAERLFRLAGYGLMKSSDAPVGIKTAKDIATGILKARATEKMGPRELNVAFVNIPAPQLPEYGEKEIE